MIQFDLGFFVVAGLAVTLIEPGLALGIMLPLLMLIDASALRPYWRKWSLPDAQVLIFGGLPGIMLGAALYRVASADVLRLLIGVVSIGFVLWQGAQAMGLVRLAGRRMSRRAGAFWGVMTGFTTFISHAGGPPAAIYLLSRGLDKTTYQATTVLTFWALNIAKFIPYAVLGMFTAQTFLANLALAPFALLGSWIGVKAHRLVPERLFFTLTYVLLLATGSKLIWDALT